MNKIVSLVNQLVKLYKTKSPFKLCKELGINIIFIDLPKKTKGVFVKTKSNKKIILINRKILNKREKIEEVCAHELAHAILHSGINTFSIEKNKKLVKKLDEEANFFAKILLKKGGVRTEYT